MSQYPRNDAYHSESRSNFGKYTGFRDQGEYQNHQPEIYTPFKSKQE